MNSFTKKVIFNQPITHNVIQIIAKISEYKGIQNLYKKQSPQMLKTLLNIATIQSTESSNRIEGIEAPHDRIVELISKKRKPKNRSEEEILGYKYTLNLIHKNHKNIIFSPNIVLQFHKELYRYTTQRAGKWKRIDNTIEEISSNGKKKIRFRPVSAFLTSEAMQQLHINFNKIWEEEKINQLLLIPTYILFLHQKEITVLFISGMTWRIFVRIVVA